MDYRETGYATIRKYAHISPLQRAPSHDECSKAMDIAGLSKLSSDTLVLVVAVLGFMVRIDMTVEAGD